MVFQDTGAFVRGLPEIIKPKGFEEYDTSADLSFVWAFLGRKGSGKSLAMATIALFLYRCGYEIFHNGGLFFGERLDFERLVNFEVRRAVVVLDEAHSVMDSRRGQTLITVEISNVLVQLRKLNVSIMWATHFPKLIDNRLHLQTELFFDCYTYDGKAVALEISDFYGIRADPGDRKRILLKNTDRTWPYYDTRAMFTGADLSNTKRRKERQENDVLWQVRGACVVMANRGEVEIAPGRLALIMSQWAGQGEKFPTISATKVGLYLTQLGFPKIKTSQSQRYDISNLLINK